jgi:cytidine deaminase
MSEKLIQSAIRASENAYVPYSHYRVGAALLTADGVIYTGCNVENASYPATICAERTALVKAVSEGVKEFDMLVVATPTGGSPCGVCRQALYEFAPDLHIIMVDFTGKIYHEAKLRDLLPLGFGGSHLDEAKGK